MERQRNGRSNLIKFKYPSTIVEFQVNKSYGIVLISLLWYLKLTNCWFVYEQSIHLNDDSYHWKMRVVSNNYYIKGWKIQISVNLFEITLQDYLVLFVLYQMYWKLFLTKNCNIVTYRLINTTDNFGNSASHRFYNFPLGKNGETFGFSFLLSFLLLFSVPSSMCWQKQKNKQTGRKKENTLLCNTGHLFMYPWE